jgi:hypothetical protein
MLLFNRWKVAKMGCLLCVKKDVVILYLRVVIIVKQKYWGTNNIME